MECGYDADLVRAVLERSQTLAPLERHAVNNAIVEYMAYSGHYGVKEVIEPTKATKIAKMLRALLE